MGDQWVGPGRKLWQYCYNCGWHGEPRVPEIKEIKTSRKVFCGPFAGFQYEVFDCYGHLLIVSQTYATEQEAKDSLNRDLKSGMTREEGPYTVVLWPSTTIVHGEVYK